MATLDPDRADAPRLQAAQDPPLSSNGSLTASNPRVRPDSRRGRQFVEIALLLIVGVLFARLFLLLVAPVPVADTPPPVVPETASAASTAVIARSPFGRVEEIVAAPADEPLVLAVEETTLDLSLHGVIADGDTSTATIRTPDGKQRVFGIGDEIVNGVTLEAVYANQVTLLRGGVREALKLPKDAPDPVTAPARRAAPRQNAPIAQPSAEIDETSPATATGQTSLLDVVRASPSRNSLGALSVTLSAAPGADAAFAALGLQDGDRLLAVENQSVTEGFQQMSAVLKSLEGKSSTTITIERDGKPMDLEIALTPGSALSDESDE